MATINADFEAIKKQYTSCRRLLELLQGTSARISSTYQEAGKTWKDERYQQLGAIVSVCCSELNRTSNQIEACMHSLKQVIDALVEYDSVNFGGSCQRESNSGGYSAGYNSLSSSTNPSGEVLESSHFTGLTSTQAGSQHGTLAGHAVTIYNSPYQTAQSHAIFAQGSAFPNSFRGTCGCCASGTLMNMAGFNFTEGDVVAYAARNGLCESGNDDPDSNGGTDAMTRQYIIQGMSGIECINTTGLYELEDLANQVENGHGVIIGVDASGLPGYNCDPNSGHAIVLASVVRNSETNAIEGYCIYDSNGQNASLSPGSDNVCQFVPAQTLDMCYESWGRRSNVTTQIIR